MKLLAALLICVSTPAVAFPGTNIQPCDNPPPLTARAPVTVPVRTYYVQPEKMDTVCHKVSGAIMFGCVFLPTGERKEAIVMINAGETNAEQGCTIVYEMAHLPPNNWVDPVAEARAPDLPNH